MPPQLYRSSGIRCQCPVERDGFNVVHNFFVERLHRTIYGRNTLTFVATRFGTQTTQAKNGTTLVGGDLRHYALRGITLSAKPGPLENAAPRAIAAA